MKRNKPRRDRLFKQYPYCYWCNQLVIYFKLSPGETMPQNFATLDHLNDLIDHDVRPQVQGQTTTVLACAKCNGGRAAEKVKALPIEVKRAKAGRPQENWEDYQERQSKIITNLTKP